MGCWLECTTFKQDYKHIIIDSTKTVQKQIV